MSRFPQKICDDLKAAQMSLESVLQDVEALIDKGFKSEKASENIKRELRSCIERYANERVTVAMIDMAIDAAKLARLERLEAEVKAAAEDLYCPDSCSDERCVGQCDCAVGRLKAALEP